MNLKRRLDTLIDCFFDNSGHFVCLLDGCCKGVRGYYVDGCVSPKA